MAGRRRSLLISRLKALECPYLQGMDDSIVVRVILTQGEARARILSWLLERFFIDLPLRTHVSMDAATLTSHFASIGLCKKENIALVEGKTSLLQQLLFLESLLDLVEAVLSTESASQLEGSCNFADTICASERLDSGVFSHLVNLLPADIARNPDTTRLVGWEELSSEAERLTAVLQERHSELHSMLQQHQYEEVNTVMMESCVKTLAVSLGTLTQLVTNFCQSYEAELQPWVGHRHPPTLGPLGPLCKRTAAHWNHISKVPLHRLHFITDNDIENLSWLSLSNPPLKVLNSLQKLEATLQGLKSMSATNMYPTCCKAQETIQQCIDLMAPVTSR